MQLLSRFDDAEKLRNEGDCHAGAWICQRYCRCCDRDHHYDRRRDLHRDRHDAVRVDDDYLDLVSIPMFLFCEFSILVFILWVNLGHRLVWGLSALQESMKTNAC